MSLGSVQTTLTFFVNGKKVIDENPNPEWTLLYYLRNKLRLCGAKLGCGEGGCGACTVMISKFDRVRKKVLHFPANTCLIPICSIHGLAVTTVEGIGSTRSKLHPVQERIAKAHGTQCGFCTPGIVMSMYSLLRSMPKPSMQELDSAFQGNLCRCTGYRPIIEAYKTFTEEWEISQRSPQEEASKTCLMGEKCCKFTTFNHDEKLFKPSSFVPYDASQEPIFPSELKLNPELDQQTLCFKSNNLTWYRPTSLATLLKLKSTYDNSKLLAGNTEIGVEIKFKNIVYPTLIHTSYIPEMISINLEDCGIRVGASVTLNDLNEELLKQIQTMPEHKTRIFASIVQMLHHFSGKQIRSVATVGGNIMNGSPISDLNPIFMAANIKMLVQGTSRPRTVALDHHFFTGYKRNILTSDEVLVSILIPYTEQNQYFYAFKQARRRDDDIAIVNSAMNFYFQDLVIENVILSFGGVAEKTITAPKTQEKLRNLTFGDVVLEVAFKTLRDDLELSNDAPGGMIRFRKALPISFFFKAFVNLSKDLGGIYPGLKVNLRDLSAIHNFTYKPPKSSQFFHVTAGEPDKFDEVGRPVVHSSAFKHASGEATFIDDIPKVDNELHMSFVYSKVAHAKLLSVDPTKALEIEGVHGFISAKDIRGGNKFGPVFQNEELFISEVITSENQLLGAILAEDRLIARKASKLVEVKYQEIQPIIVSMEDAIEHNSFYPEVRKVEAGNVQEAFKSADFIIENDCRTGCQEHFYLETQGCLVVPKEGDEFEIFSGTQYSSEVSNVVSRFLNIPQNKIITRVKRVGGGFGGKETKSVPIVVAAAIAAHKFRRPVRIMLSRDEDMGSTGGRHPFLFRYRVACKGNGKITGLEIDIFFNGGHSHDLSIAVMERVLLVLDNAYKISNVRFVGKVCRTNLPSNTVFRGSGFPQGMFCCETIIREISDYLGKDSIDIAWLNLYKEGDITPYSMKLTNLHLEDCFEECLKKSKYYERKQEVDTYNRENSWKKKGISALVFKYGCGFGVPVMEQAGALVMVYKDGSVLLTHGGVEMGQGLHIKMIQICSKVLEIPIEKIYTSECATDKVPNASPTAASFSSDLNGVAVMRACMTIKERLAPVIAQNPNASWEEWINAAYVERISLSATGYYAAPPIQYNFENASGEPFHYFTYGAACTEVEIDCLTGDHQVLRTDIVMDIGTSLNPAIDIGQIEGAFMQGYGLFVMEEMVYSPNGSLHSKGPGTYKIPGFNDIPIEFNVSLLKGMSNPKAVYSSKAVGEPPLFSGCSVLFAIREAIKSARKERGVTERFTLNAPATAEKIRMLCEDEITEKILDCNSTWSKVL